MTLSSRHRIRNSSPGGLRPSTPPLGHVGSPQNWLSIVYTPVTACFTLLKSCYWWVGDVFLLGIYQVYMSHDVPSPNRQTVILHHFKPQYWLSHVDGEETFFVSFKPPRPATEPRALAWKATVLTTTLGPPPCWCKTKFWNADQNKQKMLLE